MPSRTRFPRPKKGKHRIFRRDEDVRRVLVARALNRLLEEGDDAGLDTPDYRAGRVFLLARWFGVSVAELAEKYRETKDTINSDLRWAAERIAQLVEEELGGGKRPGADAKRVKKRIVDPVR